MTAVTHCRLCNAPTSNTAEARCDRCGQLEDRIQADPLLALGILVAWALEMRGRYDA